MYHAFLFFISHQLPSLSGKLTALHCLSVNMSLFFAHELPCCHQVLRPPRGRRHGTTCFWYHSLAFDVVLLSVTHWLCELCVCSCNFSMAVPAPFRSPLHMHPGRSTYCPFGMNDLLCKSTMLSRFSFHTSSLAHLASSLHCTVWVSIFPCFLLMDSLLPSSAATAPRAPTWYNLLLVSLTCFRCGVAVCHSLVV